MPPSANPHPGAGAGLARLGAALVLCLLGAGAARAAEPLAFAVTVLQVSDQPGPVDPSPRAQRLHALLSPKIRYESLHVLAVRRLRVPLEGIGEVRLPTGQTFRFRPIDASGSGVLVAVDLKGTMQGDFRIPPGKPLVLGGPPHEGGQLVVVLEREP